MRSFGVPGDRWSLARVFLAMLAATFVGATVGYVFDLLIGPLIGQHGWWTVTCLGGTIVGVAAQSVREFATPRDGPVYAAAPEEKGDI